MDQLDLPKISRSKPDKVKAKSSSVKLKKKIKEKKLKKQKKRKKKKKQRDSSESSTDSSSSSTTSSSSSDSSDEESNRKHKKRKKKKDKMKKKSKRSKNDGKKIETKSLDKTLQRSAVVVSPTEADVGPNISLSSSKIRAPMTKAEWEKQQSELRWVIDPETGRKRLIRGSGEVMEEIVSKERHRAINKEATAADGHYYQTQSLNMAKYST